MERKNFSKDIEKSAKELMKGRKEKSTFWHYAYIIGVGGWLFVLPVVGGAYLGHHLDRRLKGGVSWTITFIMIGIAIGIYNIWRFYLRKSE